MQNVNWRDMIAGAVVLLIILLVVHNQQQTHVILNAHARAREPVLGG